MKTTKNIQARKAMKAAWTNWKAGRYTSWSECLKSAWSWVKKTITNEFINSYTTIRETAKAILIGGQLVCTFTDQVVKANLWIPKSLIKNEGIPVWFLNKKIDEEKSMHSNYSGTIEFELY